MITGLLLLFSLQVHAVSFDRDFEGMYEIKIRCKDPAENCGASNFRHIDRLTIIDSQSTFGTWVTFAAKNAGDVIDTFLATEAGPSPLHLSGYPRTGSGMSGGGGMGRFAYFDLDVDPETGSLEGNLIDSRSVFPNLAFSGRKRQLAGDWNAGPVAAETAQVTGSYRGTFHGQPGRLTVTMRPDQKIIGYFTMDSGNLSFNYFTGGFDPQTGLLRLIFQNPRFPALGELILAYRTGGGANYFEGFQFTAFAENSVVMRKI